MKEKLARTAEVLALAAFAGVIYSATSHGGPPPPPVVAAPPPSTPVGGLEVSIATAVGIALYALWKARR